MRPRTISSPPRAPGADGRAAAAGAGSAGGDVSVAAGWSFESQFESESGSARDLREDPRIVEGALAQPVVTPRGSAVTGGIHVDLEEQRVLVRLRCAQPRHPLR